MKTTRVDHVGVDYRHFPSTATLSFTITPLYERNINKYIYLRPFYELYKPPEMSVIIKS